MSDQQDYYENEVPTRCGCGRSPSGYCIGLHGLTDEAFQKWLDANQKQED